MILSYTYYQFRCHYPLITYLSYEHMFDIKVAKLHVLKSSTSLKSLSKPYNLKIDMMCWTLKIDAFETLSKYLIMHWKSRINLVPYARHYTLCNRLLRTHSFAVNQDNHQNFDTWHMTFWLIFMGMKQKYFFFFLKKKFKMADWKKGHFSKSPILDIFFWKSTGLVLGLVGLNDAKGIDLAQPIWPWGCPTYAKNGLKQKKNAFFACFWAYVRQPHDHIS